MKKILLFAATIFVAANLNAQSPTGQGNVIIDPYVGIPNWANSIIYNNVNDNATDSLASNYKVNGGQLSYGGRVEYMVADNMGVGLDVNYEVSGFNYDYQATGDYDPVTMSYPVVPMNYDYTAKKTRIMFRLNYHFVQSDRVDAYAGFAGGYKMVNRTGVETNKATGVSTERDGFDALIPVSMRLAVGTRVYFTENIGAHVELGAFGGGLVQFGISAKF